MDYQEVKSCLISEIARSLEEKIDLKNTIERLCDNLVGMKDEEKSKSKRIIKMRLKSILK